MKTNNLILLADYHTHTIYSRNNHGKSTIEENILQAINKGLKEIIITDHGPGHVFYGIKPKKIDEIRKEINDLQEKYKGKINIKFGIEANVVDYNGKIDIEEDILDKFDIINVGYHNGVLFKNFKSFFNYFCMNFLGKFSKNIKRKIIQKNTEAMIKVIENYNIFMITHPSDKIELDIAKLARACEKNNTIMEINSSHGHLTVEELKIADKYNCNFAVGSDAHCANRVGEVEDSFKRITEAGIDIKKVVNIEFE